MLSPSDLERMARALRHGDASLPWSMVHPGKKAEYRADAQAVWDASPGPAMEEALREAAKTFREYEALHMAKGSVDGDAKARRNCELAERMEAALGSDQ